MSSVQLLLLLCLGNLILTDSCQESETIQELERLLGQDVLYVQRQQNGRCFYKLAGSDRCVCVDLSLFNN